MSDPSSPPPLPDPVPHQDPAHPSAGERMLLPVGRSGFAIAAGYLGLLSVLLVPAPFALMTGILAVRAIRKSKQSANPKHGMGRAIFGIVMGAIFTLLVIALVVVAIMEGRAT